MHFSEDWYHLFPNNPERGALVMAFEGKDCEHIRHALNLTLEEVHTIIGRIASKIFFRHFHVKAIDKGRLYKKFGYFPPSNPMRDPMF